MKDVFIGLGSNLGKREANLKRALREIGKQCRIIVQSSVIETEPVGFLQQRMFLNQVVEVETGLNPKELLGFLKSIEERMGRQKTFRNAPRIIDLDIIFYGCRVVNEGCLTIPHPRMHERMFVLKPLMEIAPDFVHPVIRKSVREMFRAVSQ